MKAWNETDDSYHGYEQGPIRPPSEAHSLLVRVNRNCPWNRCCFCPVYKNAKFSPRPVEHVKKDIDLVHKHVETLQPMADASGGIPSARVNSIVKTIPPAERQAFAAAFDWVFGGTMTSVFLQDADALAMKPAHLVEILQHLKSRFPTVRRTTSYSRARTLALRKGDDLKAIRDAGLDRVHVGLESGSDRVLARVKKGATKEMQIVAGLRVKEAGMELSEYVMPGLGGKDLSEIHARETADALNRIDPDFIRFRTLAIPPGSPLYEEYTAGRFERCTDPMIAKELLMLIEGLNGITSVIKSDHILNLFADLRGRLPRDKDRMIMMLRRFLEMDPRHQRLYQVGRRLGMFSRICDMENPHSMAEAERAYRELGVTAGNVDEITHQIAARYI